MTKAPPRLARGERMPISPGHKRRQPLTRRSIQAKQGVATPDRRGRLQRGFRPAAEETPRGVVVTFGNVLFKTNSTELLPGAVAGLDRLATYLKGPSSAVQVEGHTDRSSSTDYNIGLSQRRADSVRQALVARGVDPARIESRGYGEAVPVAGNDRQRGAR